MECLQYKKGVVYMTTNAKVLNLVINGMPSIPCYVTLIKLSYKNVLNLVINGMPSILKCTSIW